MSTHFTTGERQTPLKSLPQHQPIACGKSRGLVTAVLLYRDEQRRLSFDRDKDSDVIHRNSSILPFTARVAASPFVLFAPMFGRRQRRLDESNGARSQLACGHTCQWLGLLFLSCLRRQRQAVICEQCGSLRRRLMRRELQGGGAIAFVRRVTLAGAVRRTR